MNAGGERKKVFWRFSDGRAGHDAQSLGLVSALSDLINCDCHDIHLPIPLSSYGRGLLNLYPVISGLPDPDLLIGAGHASHIPLLLAQRVHGGQTLVLMKPSLPTQFFNLCLIPEHDKVRAADNILITEGPLNLLHPSPRLSFDHGLILVGGKSKHFNWDRQNLQQQILPVLEQNAINWTITDSPRTPETTRTFLRSLHKGKVKYLPYNDKNSVGLIALMEKAAIVWVSEDSMSMIYEALSSGAAVGILRVPKKNNGRLAEVAPTLADKQLLTLFDAWHSGQALKPPVTVLAEAERCARLLPGQLGWDPAGLP